MPMNKMFRKILLGSCCLWCAACQQQTVYHSFQPLPKEGWSKGDTLTFTLPKEQLTPGTYRMDVEVRYRPSFAYRTLWMVVYRSQGDTRPPLVDTLHCELVSKDGKLTGDGINSYYQQHCTLTGVQLDTTYTPIVRVAHYFKKGRIEGLSDIGIKLYRE